MQFEYAHNMYKVAFSTPLRQPHGVARKQIAKYRRNRLFQLRMIKKCRPQIQEAVNDWLREMERKALSGA
jgi:hypothetical protein